MSLAVAPLSLAAMPVSLAAVSVSLAGARLSRAGSGCPSHRYESGQHHCAESGAPKSRAQGSRPADCASPTGVPATPEERKACADLGCATLLHLHDELDASVLEAYGWPRNIAEADLLARLVELNAARAAEEAGGTIRWIRRSYQEPLFRSRMAGTQTVLAAAQTSASQERRNAELRAIWVPGDGRDELKAQTAAIRTVLSRASGPLGVDEIVAALEKPARAKVAPAVARHLAALEGVGAVISVLRDGLDVWTLAE